MCKVKRVSHSFTVFISTESFHNHGGRLRCNSVPDCVDESDELNCTFSSKIMMANLVSINGADCPLNEYIVDKGPEWPDFFRVVHGLGVKQKFLYVTCLIKFLNCSKD